MNPLSAAALAAGLVLLSALLYRVCEKGWCFTLRLWELHRELKGLEREIGSLADSMETMRRVQKEMAREFEKAGEMVGTQAQPQLRKYVEELKHIYKEALREYESAGKGTPQNPP